MYMYISVRACVCVHVCVCVYFSCPLLCPDTTYIHVFMCTFTLTLSCVMENYT